MLKNYIRNNVLGRERKREGEKYFSFSLRKYSELTQNNLLLNSNSATIYIYY